MAYLTEREFEGFGFEEVEDFELLAKRAEVAIDLYTGNFYSAVDFESDFEPRKKAVKQAMAFQIAYLDSSGILTAEDKQAMAGVTLGRTSINYSGGRQTASQTRSLAERYNLSLDAESLLRGAGFGYAGVNYDRY
ncbi:hypothetical protein [Streptococcus marmotae]|uniref:hypothetical protein n=1 Tax=Streptococcus marmotae TaxID=1825069 RepID=UPI000A85EE2E|nr:hypothetical protein [Streptococcus marmotae]QBX16922.1 hypothetical protein Javan291_0046 [Streptococcus phage Javan291]